MNMAEMRKMYMRHGEVWAVPEIKNEGDMRKFFGNPAAPGGAELKDEETTDRIQKAARWSYALGVLQRFSGVAVVLFPLACLCLLRRVKG